MNRADNVMFIRLSQNLISELTVELNSELEKIHIDISDDEKTTILDNCDKAISDMNNRLAQLKSILK